MKIYYQIVLSNRSQSIIPLIGKNMGTIIDGHKNAQSIVQESCAGNNLGTIGNNGND